MDINENGEVRYEMKKGHGELFKVERKTGEVILKQPLEGHNKDYQLIISAFDGGIIPCSTDVTVNVKVNIWAVYITFIIVVTILATILSRLNT